ncbi:MAG: DUF2267 domain-containing protein [Deltaproteobacteria bacterium]|nr:DUF2267 domain-containing protein [Deltaproteobacteria bacterium]
MKFNQFVTLVERLGEIPTNEQALKIIRTTLELLAELLPAGHCDAVRAELPPEIGNFLSISAVRMGQTFSLGEFFERICEESGETMQNVVPQVRAVSEVLRESVSEKVLMEMYAGLPDEYRQLFDAGPEPSDGKSQS